VLCGVHEDLADLDLDRDASRLERVAHDLERRREAPVGPQSSEHRW
jgi:hypothetical protein